MNEIGTLREIKSGDLEHEYIYLPRIGIKKTDPLKILTLYITNTSVDTEIRTRFRSHSDPREILGRYLNVV